MRALSRQFPLVLAAVLVCSGVTRGDDPPRLKRADSFLGIHFDFHAGPDGKEVGKHTTKEMVDRILDLVHPDYLQVDCKGHPGYSSYPTKVGNPVPGFVGDPLRVWRQATAARGVGLYMHYSGVWDSRAIALHPEWAAVDPNGKPSRNNTSTFGPYADRLLIPQLRELAGTYGVDGVWVDGDCWAAQPDYGPAAVAAWKATGRTTVPRGAGDPHWAEFLQFHRAAYRNYLRHYVTEVKRTNPTFQICSNWAFTDHMPEPVSVPVDFLSGDFSPEDSVNSARLSARYLARQGKPWDLMAWSFTIHPKREQKPAVQLQREAAMVLACGGGFQAYFTQNRDGSVRLPELAVMAEVAKFCRARQRICHRAVAVPQIGVIFSTADQYHRIHGLFARDLHRIHGVLQPLVESQQSVELLGESQLTGRLADYPLLVLPEARYLEPAFRDSLVGYVRSGGNLLLVGESSARLFERELGVTFQGDTKFAPLTLVHGEVRQPIHTPTLAVALANGTRGFGRLDPTDAKAPGQPAASIASLGKGKIAAVYFAAGQATMNGRPAGVRRFLADLTHELFPRPLVEVTGSADVDVCVARNHDALLVNLVNTGGPHQSVSILPSIAPIGPLAVAVRADARPSAVTLEPGARPLPFDYRDGVIRLSVPRVEIHEVVVVKP
ncbi:MAG: alpha-amylase family protein [Gemmataceae bacterium]